MDQVKEIENMIAALKKARAAIIRKNKMSEKESLYTLENSTDRQRGKSRENLNWQSMEAEKRKIDVARLFKDGCCDVGTETRYFKPSGFHEYKY